MQSMLSTIRAHNLSLKLGFFSFEKLVPLFVIALQLHFETTSIFYTYLLRTHTLLARTWNSLWRTPANSEMFIFTPHNLYYLASAINTLMNFEKYSDSTYKKV